MARNGCATVIVWPLLSRVPLPLYTLTDPRLPRNAAFAPLWGPLLAFYGLVLVIVAVYNIVLWAWLGGTLGQRAMGMEVRRESDGRRVGFWRACLRYLGYIVASIPFAIGIFWIGLDPRKQGWHDKIAGTVVVRDETVGFGARSTT